LGLTGPSGESASQAGDRAGVGDQIDRNRFSHAARSNEEMGEGDNGGSSGGRRPKPPKEVSLTDPQATWNTGCGGLIIAAETAIAKATSPSIRPWFFALSNFRLPVASGSGRCTWNLSQGRKSVCEKCWTLVRALSHACARVIATSKKNNARWMISRFPMFSSGKTAARPSQSVVASWRNNHESTVPI